MKEKILETLERKQKQYREINAWFENEYDSSTSADTLAEWEKKAIEVHAQIQILLFLLSDDVEDSYVIRDTEHPYLKIKETGEEWTLGKYASRFTKLVYTDIEDICISMTDNMYYLLDECGNWEYLNPEKVEILKTKDINYIKKIDKELKKKYKKENKNVF